MRKIIVILSTCLLLTGCGTNYKNALTTTNGEYFTVVKEWDDSWDTYKIVYANDTKVKYLIWKGLQRGSMIPLYNADGSLQIYEEE
jgi:major membrane immunogen (membrane-anchored lipoprotein)